MEEIPVDSLCYSSAIFAAILFSFQIWPFGQRLQALIQRSNPKKSKAQILVLTTQLANRLTGVMHNLIQIPFALYLLLDPAIHGDHLYGSTPASKICHVITVGYFIVDTFICTWYYKQEGPLFLFHAIACLVLYAYGFVSGFLHYYGAAFLLWELSTPFVHARWLMHILHLHDSNAYFINGILMLVTFFSVRCVYGIYLSFDFWKTSAAELQQLRSDGLSFGVIWLYRMVNVGLNGLNLFWMTKMIQKATAFVKAKKQ